MFEQVLKKKLKKLKELFGNTNVERELLPLTGEEVRIKKKKS